MTIIIPDNEKILKLYSSKKYWKKTLTGPLELKKNIKPKMFFSKTPILHSAINASTFGNTPFAELMRSLKHEEKNNPNILIMGATGKLGNILLNFCNKKSIKIWQKIHIKQVVKRFRKKYEI